MSDANETTRRDLERDARARATEELHESTEAERGSAHDSAHEARDASERAAAGAGGSETLDDEGEDTAIDLLALTASAGAPGLV